MKHLLLLVFLLAYWPIIAQKIAHNKAVEDLNFLIEGIKQYNPALGRYHPEFDSLSNLVVQHLQQDSLSVLEHFTNISRVCALANEGHFLVGNQETVFNQGINKNQYAYLPIQIKIVAGRLFVYGDFSNEQLTNRGDEIIAINGLKSSQILDSLLAFTPSDGYIKSYAYRKIESNFSVRYYFHIQQTNNFEITLLDAQQQEKKIALQALVQSKQIENLKKYYPNNNKKKSTDDEGFYTLEIKDNYSYLKLPSFDFRRVNKYQVKSKKLYKNLFKELRDNKAQNLVIDLRNNTGGRNEFADDIVPFIRKPNTSTPFLKKTIGWNGKTRTYRLPKASKLAFQGSIYVLVNGKTFSAGGSIARYLKEYGHATIIGTETGTRYEGFAAGSAEHIILPHSKINIGIPRFLILFPTSKQQATSNRGIIPDHKIEPSFEVYTKGTDLHLQKVQTLIK
jgi:C-terminal processing protease CtpA/Prc